MAARARGYPGAIVLGGVLAWGLAVAPVGAQEATGANVVAQQNATRTAKKITTLLNVISNLPGADRGREKYVNEIVAAAAGAAARGHTPDNAAQWQSLGAQRRSFLVLRQQEARTGAEADKRRFEQDRWMWCRLQMLQAAAYIVDGGDENIRRAVSILEQVLVEGKEIKNFSKRWDILDRVDALGAAAILLKPPPPVAEATRKRFARRKDRAGLAGPIKNLYSQTDPKEATELVHRTRQRLRGLIGDRAAGPIRRKPNRFRAEAEGVVAEAVDSFLTSIILLKDHNAMSARELTRARHLAGRYRIPPALEAEFRAALTRKGRQLVIHDAFARWTADPYGEEAKLGKLLGAAHPDPLPALRYYRAIYDAWRTDKLHRRNDLDETQYTYQQSLQFFRRELDRARRETPNIVTGGASPVERYAQALLDMAATPSRPGPMSALDRTSWDADSPLERSIQRAVRYHLLNRAAVDS